MRLIGLASIGLLLIASITLAQAPTAEPQPVGTVADVMVSMTYPAANDILLSVYRGGPQNEKEWVTLQRSAVLLAESGNALTIRGRARDAGEWMKDARVLSDVGAAAYRAARAKDAAALLPLTEQLNASCITCHKQYRPNVHPRPQSGG